MLIRGTLNGINSGPSGGKSTLLAQLGQASIYKMPFFIPEITLPEGKIAWFQTDRKKAQYQPLLSTLGLWDHPSLHIENFLDDTSLHDLTYPVQQKNKAASVEKLRNELSRRIKGKGIGTVILDLYDPYHAGSTNQEASYYSRANAIWAAEMNVALIAVVYPFKQTTSKQALRMQDRAGGFLQLQSSMDYKITMIDAEESATPYGILCVVPPSGSGRRFEIMTIRGKEEDGDLIGAFSKYEGEKIPDIGEIMSKFNCNETKAYSLRKQIAAGENPEYLR